MCPLSDFATLLVGPCLSCSLGFPRLGTGNEPHHWDDLLSYPFCASPSLFFSFWILCLQREIKSFPFSWGHLYKKKSSSGKRRKRNVFSLKLQHTPLSPFPLSFWWFVSTELGLMVCLFWSGVSKGLPDQTYWKMPTDPLGISVSHSFSTFFNYAIHA